MSNGKMQCVGYKHIGFRGSVAMEIPWRFAQVLLWVWHEYGD